MQYFISNSAASPIVWQKELYKQTYTVKKATATSLLMNSSRERFAEINAIFQVAAGALQPMSSTRGSQDLPVGLLRLQCQKLCR